MISQSSMIYTLLCDFACKLVGESNIAGQYISISSNFMETDEIRAVLVKEAGVNYGNDLTKWVAWYLDNEKKISDQEKGILYLINIMGRIRNIKSQRTPDDA